MNLALQHALLRLILPISILITLTKLARIVIKRRNSPLALLRGPPATSRILPGRLFEFLASDDIGSLCELWATRYGLIFKIPTWLGGSHVALCDPRAIAHVLAKDGFTYVRNPFTKTFIKTFFGETMVAVDREDHRRMRRNMAPAFSISALRALTAIFYDSAYKVKSHWDTLLESSDDVIVDVENWMNRTTLDTIGIAGFGHDFRAIHGHRSPVYEAFSSLNESDNARPFRLFMLLGSFFPPVVKLPLGITLPFRRLRKATSEIATQLLDHSRRAESDSDIMKDRSILGMLLKGQTEDANFKLLQDEVKGQSHFLIAGYDTMAISLSWTLVELARHPEVQEKLREELRQFSGSDPTWDQLMYGLPYLDAIAQESLRLHAPVEMTTRMPAEDDTIPLSEPIQTTSGKMKDSVLIPKGTTVIIPIKYFNRCEAIWGPDAKQFVPERWLKEKRDDLKDSGSQRLYSFLDGPRICLGKVFAMAEFKAVLSVLVCNFSFEFPGGPDTKVVFERSGFIPRPKVAGEAGCVLPMRIRQVAK